MWESITPTQEATQKRCSPSLQHQGRLRSVEVLNPNSSGCTEAWESLTPPERATSTRQSPYMTAWESIDTPEGATLKHGGR